LEKVSVISRGVDTVIISVRQRRPTTRRYRDYNIPSLQALSQFFARVRKIEYLKGLAVGSRVGSRGVSAVGQVRRSGTVCLAGLGLLHHWPDVVEEGDAGEGGDVGQGARLPVPGQPARSRRWCVPAYARSRHRCLASLCEVAPPELAEGREEAAGGEKGGGGQRREGRRWPAERREEAEQMQEMSRDRFQAVGIASGIYTVAFGCKSQFVRRFGWPLAYKCGKPA
jgi:hypothetical protein